MNCVLKALKILTSYSDEFLKDYFSDKPFFEENWAPLFEQQGFKKVLINPVPFQKRMTVKQLAGLVSSDELILARCAHHVIAIKDKEIYDSEFSWDLCVYHYYVKKVE